MRVFTRDELVRVDDDFKVLLNTDRSQLAVMVLGYEQTSGEFGTDHPHADQFVLVLEGQGQLILRGEDFALNPGDTLVIPAGADHQFVGMSEQRFRVVTVYSPVAYPDETPEEPEVSDNPPISFEAEQKR